MREPAGKAKIEAESVEKCQRTGQESMREQYQLVHRSYEENQQGTRQKLCKKSSLDQARKYKSSRKGGRKYKKSSKQLGREQTKNQGGTRNKVASNPAIKHASKVEFN